MGYDTVIYLLSNVFRVYVYARFCKAFLNEKADLIKRTEFWAFGLFYIVNSTMHVWMRNPLLNLLVNLFGLLAIVDFLYEDFLRKKIFLVVGAIAALMASEIVCIAIFDNYESSEQNYTLLIVLAILMVFLIELILEKLFSKKNSEFNLKNPHWMLLLVIPIGSIIIGIALYLSGILAEFFSLLIAFVLMSMNIAAFSLYDTIMKTYQKEKENYLVKNQLKMYQNQFEIQKTSQENIKALKHDLKSHLTEVYMLVWNDKRTDALKYLKEMFGVMTNSFEYVSTGNNTLDSILNFWFNEIGKREICLKMSIKVPKKLEITDFNVNIILSNLLENAMEASEKSMDKFIEFRMEYTKGGLKIKCKNSFSGNLKIGKEGFKTKKINREEHGIGLSNIRKVVGIYNGNFEISVIEPFFIVEIILII